MLLLTLRGTPTLYYGDELGIADVVIPKNRQCDPWGRNESAFNVSRDPARTPMQWDNTPYAGFSTHEPWLPLTEDHRTRNFVMLQRDAYSILSLYRNLLMLRRRFKALHMGDWRRLDAPEQILVYERRHDGERIFVALNFGDVATHVLLPENGRLLLSTQGDRTDENITGAIRLRADEGVMIAALPTD
jgi:alpha-glucosidase